MMRIETVGRVGPAHGRGGRAAAETPPPAAPAGRALVVLDGGGPGRSAPAPRVERPDARFLAQLIACAEPTPRLERTRAASGAYAAAARRTA